MLPSRKVCTFERLISLRAEARDAGRTVVHCHGCFDVVHPGHIRHLQYARTLGDMLVVTVSADSHVNKGVDRPLIPDELRAASLAALECVDWVYVNPQPTAVELLEALKPDVYVKGAEYEKNQDPRFVAERQTVINHGGRVVFSSGDVVYSSTALIGSLESLDAFNGEKLARFRTSYGLSGSRLQELMHRIRGQRVLVIGDYLLDRYHFCEAATVASEAPVMTLRLVGRRDYDGGAAVIASHLAALGASPVLVSSLPSDGQSSEIQLRLRAAGVNVEALERGRQITTKHRYLVDTQKLMKLDDGAPAPLDSTEAAALAERIIALADGAAAVIFADFGYGLVTDGLLNRILGPLRRKVPILAAAVSGHRSSLTRFIGADLICATEQEVRDSLADLTSGLTAVASKLLSAVEARQLIVTLGKQGLVVCDQHRPSRSDEAWERRLRSEYVPSLAGRPVDPLGCGDALLATATAALAAGGSVQAAALLGSMAAAAHAQELGNPPIKVERMTAGLQEPEPAAARLAS